MEAPFIRTRALPISNGMIRNDTTTKAWGDYELIDSGDFRKLERFGAVTLDRPDPQAVWPKTDVPAWAAAQAQFAAGTKGEKWAIARGTPDAWTVSFDRVKLNLSFGNFKHIGIFPEHAAQWELIANICDETPGLTMLNLFGYTGGASLVAAAHGAMVTHVDASKQTMQTVKDNIIASGLPADCMRLVVEDALKYAKRLVARGEQFDIITMDPPAFGRGPKGEVWKIEEKLAELMALLPALVSPHARLVVLNGYAAGFSARSFGQVLHDAMHEKGGDISYGDVTIAQRGDHVLPTGIYAMWNK